MTPLMGSLDANLKGTMKCHPSGLSGFMSCPYSAAQQEQGVGSVSGLWHRDHFAVKATMM